MDNYVTGRINRQIRLRIANRINEAIEESTMFKVGKTGDSWIRTDAVDYREQPYKKMHLIFRSSSKQVIDELEVEYITKYLKKEPNRCMNKSTAKLGNMFTYDGYYWLYIVTDK